MKFITLTTEHTHRGVNYINYSKQKKLRYDKINPDPYAKRAARRVAATPAVRSHRVGPASRTPPGPACRLWKTLTWPFRALTARTLVNYTGRRQQIHGDLRIQHPEWVEPNGESSMRLMEELDTLTRRGSNESIAAPHRALEQGTGR